MYCTNCGTNVPEGELFCTNCGASMKNGSRQLEKEMTPKSRVNQGNMNNQFGVNRGEGQTKIRTGEQDKSYEFIKAHPSALRIASIVGSIIMFISLWLPLVIEKLPVITLESFSTGEAGVQKIKYSLWNLCQEVDGLEVFAYFSLICIILSIVFALLKKHLPVLIFGTLEILPVYLMFFVALSVEDRMSPSIAAFTTLIGWITIVASWKMNRKFKKMTAR